MEKGQEQDGSKKKIPKGVIVLAVLTALVAVAYGWGVFYFHNRFLMGTVIGQVDASAKTVEELERQVADYFLKVIEQKEDGAALEEDLLGSEISLAYADPDRLRSILGSQNFWLWFLPRKASYEMEEMLSYDEAALKERVQALQGFQKDFVVEPADARISEYTREEGFRIVPEVQGNKLNFQKTLSAVQSAVGRMEKTVDLEAAGCYESPKVTSEDEELVKTLDILKKYAELTITYQFGDVTEILDGNIISGWLEIHGDRVDIDTEKVKEFVASLRKNHDTIFHSRTFLTTYGKEITIKGGDYGWWMDSEQETKELEEMIRGGESGERTPVYHQTAACYGALDYGDTYVEINLTAQHLFLYVEGELKLETDFVSGNISRGNGTPTGVYGITYKERNATLRGENYATPVKWWMPFNGNVGMHDASWRASFGSNIYQTNGSHGCINLPSKMAEEIYSLVSKGTPVIVYELPGTEPRPVVPAPGVPETGPSVPEVEPVVPEAPPVIPEAVPTASAASEARDAA